MAVMKTTQTYSAKKGIDKYRVCLGGGGGRVRVGKEIGKIFLRALNRKRVQEEV